MEPAKIQGDKLEISQPVLHKESIILGTRPIDVDQEKKHGDPLLDAASFSEPQPEVIHTGKLARELPEYHQGEARLRPVVVKAEPLPTEILSAQAAVLAENAKEIAQDSKEFVEEKAHTLYDSAVTKAYEGEQYLLEKAVDAELYLQEKGKQAYRKGGEILVNTIAPAVGQALGTAYVALKSATGLAVEKGKEEAEYLQEKAAVIGEEMVKEAKILKEEALVYGSEIATEAKVLAEEAAVKGSELAKEAAVKGSELAVKGSELAMEAAVKGSELASEAAVKGSELAKEAAVKTQEGLAVASEVGKEAILSAAEKTSQTMEYLEKEAVLLSQEGVEYIQQQKEQVSGYVSEQMEHIAEESKHNTEAAMLLRELADETEIKKKQEYDQAARLRMEHDKVAHAAARKANFLQHERAFEQDISAHLTSSLRESHIEAEERALEEGEYQELIDSPATIVLQPIDSPAIAVTKAELQPLLPHPTTFVEPSTPQSY